MALGQDKNDDEGAAEKFKKVNNAYNTLKNGGNGRAVGGDGEYDDEPDDEYDDTPYEDFADFFEEFYYELGRFFMSRRGGPRGVFFPSGCGGPAFFAMGGAGMGARRGAGPQPRCSSDKVIVCIRRQGDKPKKFKIFMTDPMGKAFEAFCEAKNLDIGSVRFVFDGLPVQGKKTPQDLDMEAGEENLVDAELR